MERRDLIARRLASNPIRSCIHLGIESTRWTLRIGGLQRRLRKLVDMVGMWRVTVPLTWEIPTSGLPEKMGYYAGVAPKGRAWMRWKLGSHDMLER